MPTNPLRLKRIRTLASPKRLPGAPTSSVVPPMERHDYCLHNDPNRVYQGLMTVSMGLLECLYFCALVFVLYACQFYCSCQSDGFNVLKIYTLGQEETERQRSLEERGVA